jgi:hypothetical protein
MSRSDIVTTRVTYPPAKRRPMIQPMSIGQPAVNRGERAHVVEDCHFEPVNGPAWALCSCGERVEVEHGDGKGRLTFSGSGILGSRPGSLTAAFDSHRVTAGAPPVAQASGAARKHWAKRQEAMV